MGTQRAAAAAAICLAACGVDHATDPGSPYSLTLVGDVNLVLHPLAQRTLQVMLTQLETGPAANAQIHFELQGDGTSGSSIDATDVITGADGVAGVTFTAGASASGHPTFKLIASAAELGPAPAAFGLTVIPVHRLLQIVGSTTTRPRADGSSASAALAPSETAALQVREIDADTGAAIAGDTVEFTLPPSAKSHWSGASTSTTSTTTAAGGEAQALLLTSAAEAPFLVQAASTSGGSAASFAITVASAQTGDTCATNQECAIGEVCGGSPATCQPIADGSGCTGDQSCPTGYGCVDGTCQPPAGSACDAASSSCTSGFCCDGVQCIADCSATCAAGSHCIAGDSCGQGSCVSDTTAPDLTGLWTTRHDFDIAATLPLLTRGVFGELRFLDQAILGKLTLPGLPGVVQDIINTFISALLQHYLPNWLQQLISAGDDLGTILSNLRAEGSMRLVPNGDLTHLKGTEAWTSLVFYWLPLCGGDIQGDPLHPPDCARLDLATSDSLDFGGSGQCKGQALPAITARVQPFTATVAGNQLQVDERFIKLEMGKVVLVLIDYLTAIVSAGQYHCIDEATDCNSANGCIVDCSGLANDISSATNGIVPAQRLEPLCGEAVAEVGRTVSAALAALWSPTVDTLQFSGRATIRVDPELSSCDDSSGGVCAIQLGNDAWDGLPLRDRDGAWDGTLFSVKNLPGSWQATRPE
jgi:hypothetical protein